MIYDREYRFIVPQEIYQLNNVVRAASLPPSCAPPLGIADTYMKRLGFVVRKQR
jgi:hypothetical protein